MQAITAGIVQHVGNNVSPEVPLSVSLHASCMKSLAISEATQSLPLLTANTILTQAFTTPIFQPTRNGIGSGAVPSLSLPRADAGNRVEMEVTLAASLDASGVAPAHTDMMVGSLFVLNGTTPVTARAVSSVVRPIIDMEPCDTRDDLKEMTEMVTSFNSDLAQEEASVGHISMPDFPELDLSCSDDIFQTEGIRPLPCLLSPINVPSKGNSQQKRCPISVDLLGHVSSWRTDDAEPVDMKKPKPEGKSPSRKKRISEKSCHENLHHINRRDTSAMPRNKDLRHHDYRRRFNQNPQQPERLPYPSCEKGHWTSDHITKRISVIPIRCQRIHRTTAIENGEIQCAEGN